MRPTRLLPDSPHFRKEHPLQMPPSVFRGVALPELINDEQHKWVFTHRSVVTIPSTVRITEAATEDYERWAKDFNGGSLTLQG